MNLGALLVFLCGFLLSISSWSDEGMWVFNQLPLDQIQKKYGFRPSPEWIENIMRASVRISYGGSGSFISSDGLILTNHHVASDAIDHLAKKDGKDYIKNGFSAQKQQDERSPEDGLEVEQLVAIQDVSQEVLGTVTPKMTPEKADAAKKSKIAELTQKAEKETQMKCEIVTLYQGGQYHLYQYKVYRDVRLVFAPEKDIAFFGGDPDNFEFPRYDLDMSILRAYENGKPAKIQHFLKLPTEPLKEGDLTFVSGNPGTTQRLLSVAALEFVRDIELPLRMNALHRREVLLKSWSDRSAQNRQRAEDELFSYQNSRKVVRGQVQGLQDPQLWNQLKKKESDLIQSIRSRPELSGSLSALDRIQEARLKFKEFYLGYRLFEQGLAFNSELFAYARTLVRAAEERVKPDGERLEEFAQAKLKSLENRLFSDHLIYADLEILKLSDSLGFAQELLPSWGQSDFYKKWFLKALKNRSASENAAEWVKGSRLGDVSVRKKLYEGGIQAIEKSRDPMILLARELDAEARKLRKRYEIEVREVERTAYSALARARFAIYGVSVYPDATFSPRLAFGVVAGWKQAGESIPAFTQIRGAFEREKDHEAQEPFRLPKSWHLAKDEGKLDLSVPFNFVSTTDIIGGNSGSPVIDQKGALVGLIFDGNLESLVGSFTYDGRSDRSVSVDVRAILHTMKKVYAMDRIVDQIGK